jgi:hypothetical protein
MPGVFFMIWYVMDLAGLWAWKGDGENHSWSFYSFSCIAHFRFFTLVSEVMATEDLPVSARSTTVAGF